MSKLFVMMHATVVLFVALCSSLALFSSTCAAATTAAPIETHSDTSIAWNVTATAKKSGKKILSATFGSARVGKIHALLGPSGCGKTTLLNALSGDVPSTIQLGGDISAANPFKPIYIQQQDLLFAQLTTTETLETSYQLTSSSNGRSAKEVVPSLLNDLSLKKVAKTKVGDEKTRGLSGGEKKRLSIGNEIINSNVEGVFLFADEPTSGLDCFQAQKVVGLLKQLAERGNTVIFSIHQPRSTIFELFDDITLLSEGRVIYSGPVDAMVPYFQAQGYPCPPRSNPSEYYVDLVSVDFSSPEEEAISRKRIAALAAAFASSNYANAHRKKVNADGMLLEPATSKRTSNVEVASLEKKKLGFFGRLKRSLNVFRILNVRAWRQVTRDKALNIARFSSSLFSALLFGAIYFKMGVGAKTIPDRLGLLQVAAVNTAMVSLIKATTSFVTEKLIVQRERRRGSYGVVPYFMAKILAEVPLSALFPCMSGVIMYKLCGLNDAPGKLWNFLAILVVESLASTSLGMSIGSLVPTVESGVAIAPAVMVIFIVFGGLYVVNTPSYLAWVPKASLIRWAYEALCVNEFTGLELQSDGSMKPGPPAGVVIRGEDTLQRMGMGGSDVPKTLLAQAGIIVFNYVFTCMMLFAQRPTGAAGAGGGRSTVSADGKAVSLLHNAIDED